jgi:hypothetical protein
MDLKKLQNYFKPQDVEWRVQRSTKKGDKAYAVVLPYINNRAIMERLDEVVGPQNWKNEFYEWKGKGVKCGISVRVGDEWITKYDGADDTNFEATKGGFSDSMKRAAVQWGIGRYLYDLEPKVVEISNQKGDNYVNDKDKGVTGYWSNPLMPQWAIPDYKTTTTMTVQNSKTKTTSNISTSSKKK